MTNHTKIDYKLAFNFFLADREWRTKIGRLALTFLLSILIYPVFVGFGYAIEISRRVAMGKRFSLPKWDKRWSHFASVGFRSSVAPAVLGLPVLLSYLVLSRMLRVGYLMSWQYYSISQVVGIVSAFILSVVTIRFIQTDSIRRCFDIRDMFEFVRDNLRNYASIILLLYLLGIPEQVLATVFTKNVALNCFFYLPISFMITMYLAVVRAHLDGQLIAIDAGRHNH